MRGEVIVSVHWWCNVGVEAVCGVEGFNVV